MESFHFPGEDSTLGTILQHYLLQLDDVTYAGYEVNEDTKIMTLHVETKNGLDPKRAIQLAARHAKECIAKL